MGKLFLALRKAAMLFIPAMKTVWQEPYNGKPCVFVCNHAGAMGPIGMMTRFEQWDRCDAWCNEGIMNKETVPAYVRQDYWWEPGCRMEKVYDAILPNLAACILPPVLQSAPTIPVYHDARVMTTMRSSLRSLKSGRNLIIFPEQPSGHGTSHEWINTGWLNLCTMYARATGEGLTLYPTHLDFDHHEIRIAPAVVFDPEKALDEQLDSIVASLKKGLWDRKEEK